jgi:hypothetical protein
MPLISKENLNTPIYYYREFENDLSSYLNFDVWLPVTKRVGKAVLPFLSLYKPLSPSITLCFSILRVCTYGKELLIELVVGDYWKIALSVLKTSWAFAAFLGTLLLHSAGMMLTTCLDLFINSIQLVQYLYGQQYVEACLKLLSLLKNAFYFALFFYSGIELVIASLALQLLACMVLSINEFRKGNLIEGGAEVLMACVRGGQLTEQIQIAHSSFHAEM